MRSKRLNSIENYVYEHRTVTLDQLCEVFQVSKNTIRRDVKEIVKDGNIKKIYGGVRVKSSSELLPFNERNISYLEEKKAIALKAAQLVEDGDVIFIDSGTTTLHILEYVYDKKNLTVITNNLAVVMGAVKWEDIKVISLPGELDRKTLSFTGDSGLNVLQKYNITKAFMASAGVSIDGGVTNSSTNEYPIKSYIVQRSKKVYLLAGKEKFGLSAITTYCTLDQLTAIITDQVPTGELKEYLDDKGVQIIV